MNERGVQNDRSMRPARAGESAATMTDRALRLALGIGAFALVCCAVGAVFDPRQFFRAYLATYQFYLGLGLGCLVLLLIYCLTGGAWGFVIRPILESGVATLPLLAVGFLPIPFGLRHLYIWAQPELVEQSGKLQFQAHYLNPGFFCARAAFYFLVWLASAYLLTSWSREHQRTGDARYWRRRLNLAGPALLLYGVTIHFAAADWVMSLQTDFHSTIFGPLTVAGQLMSALALAVFALPGVAARPSWSSTLSPKTLNDLGNLLLSFVVIWMYMEWFQFMLVWIANMQSDVVWYAPRLVDGWQWVSLGLVALHFAVPFCALLLRRVKQSLCSLQRVAALLLLSHSAFLFYQVLPAFPDQSPSAIWMDLLLPIGWGGIFWALFLHRLRDRSVLPEHDPNGIEARRLRKLDEEEAHWEETLQHV